ncbi:uncharacterized protein SETTUDRAFT_168336 [Exserohilum turcica Et28A]|uniref:Uncharacterized protein n=1 Tax=Exserohilum turcicum (strain 28A) TaxID=671987 RepID=R0IUE9_EXST2|nr:uncharacterized protein SETTUDRAFT_168336 [Exserohilum turcica Et28A]EOA88430.1 hypothetical protein SETTUDRAFT_168336 [Exserohilum turcica Et28A]
MIATSIFSPMHCKAAKHHTTAHSAQRTAHRAVPCPALSTAEIPVEATIQFQHT